MKEFCNNRKAFTLAETLIALGIIGIVAVTVMPTLIQKYQEKSWQTASNVFEKRLNEALKVMNVQDTLAGRKDTGAFLNELGKNFKIAKICEVNELEQCFTSSILSEIIDYDSTDLQSTTTFSLSEIKSNNTIRNTSYSTGVKGVIFANGVSALIEYNPKCPRDQYNNQFNGMDCMAILYDVNGGKTPNTVGKDIVSLKTKMNGGIKFGGKTWSEPKVANTPLSYDECMKTKDSLGIKNCANAYKTGEISDKDYWGGAVKFCGGVDKLPTPSDLSKLQESLGGSVGHWDSSKGFGTCETYPNCLDVEKAKIFYDALNIPNTRHFYIWSNKEIDAQYATRKLFYPTSYTNSTPRRTVLDEVCIVMCKTE